MSLVLNFRTNVFLKASLNVNQLQTNPQACIWGQEGGHLALGRVDGDRLLTHQPPELSQNLTLQPWLCDVCNRIAGSVQGRRPEECHLGGRELVQIIPVILFLLGVDLGHHKSSFPQLGTPKLRMRAANCPKPRTKSWAS